MEHYQTYLRAELGKLRDLGECRKFVEKSGRHLGGVGLPADASALNRRFPDQTRVNLFVGSLDDRVLVELTAACGIWRDNGIADKLSPNQRPALHLVTTSRIRLNDAEECLAPAFERLDRQLVAIARDEAVLATEPYRSRGPNEEIDFGICLANPDPDRPGGYRIFDGMHRAIQSIRNNVPTIMLCVVGPA